MKINTMYERATYYIHLLKSMTYEQYVTLFTCFFIHIQKMVTKWFSEKPTILHEKPNNHFVKTITLKKESPVDFLFLGQQMEPEYISEEITRYFDESNIQNMVDKEFNDFWKETEEEFVEKLFVIKNDKHIVVKRQQHGDEYNLKKNVTIKPSLSNKCILFVEYNDMNGNTMELDIDRNYYANENELFTPSFIKWKLEELGYKFFNEKYELKMMNSDLEEFSISSDTYLKFYENSYKVVPIIISATASMSSEVRYDSEEERSEQERSEEEYNESDHSYTQSEEEEEEEEQESTCNTGSDRYDVSFTYRSSDEC